MDTHWRNSMKPARFFFLDARAAVPFVIAMLHLRWYTLVLAAITTLIFYFFEVRGLNFFAALRALRCWLITNKRPNIRHSDLNRWVDYAYEDTEKNMFKLGAMPVEPNQDDGFDMEKPAESAIKIVKKTAKKIRKKVAKAAPASAPPQTDQKTSAAKGAATSSKNPATKGKTVAPAPKASAKS